MNKLLIFLFLFVRPAIPITATPSDGFSTPFRRKIRGHIQWITPFFGLVFQILSFF